jgi:hypothetical protein
MRNRILIASEDVSVPGCSRSLKRIFERFEYTSFKKSKIAKLALGMSFVDEIQSLSILLLCRIQGIS